MNKETLDILVYELRRLGELLSGPHQYESMTLCPDREVGHQALHEALQSGWEIVAQWREDDVNHMALRRRVC